MTSYVLLSVVIKEWSLELYGTNGTDPNAAVVRANRTATMVKKQPAQACELPTHTLDDVMAEESHVSTRCHGLTVCFQHWCTSKDLFQYKFICPNLLISPLINI